MVNIGKTIRKESTKIVKKAVDPVKQEAQKATAEITKLQNMVKCPVSVTSNFPKCATNYLLDIFGYILFGVATIFRAFFLGLIANFFIWIINWFIAIPYFEWFFRHKNDVIRIVNIFFPYFNRTKDMNKCYCGSSLVWLFQPLQVKEQSWTEWLASLFDPILRVARWMLSAYTESFTGEDTVAVSMAPLIVAGGMVLIFLLFFWVIC